MCLRQRSGSHASRLLPPAPPREFNQLPTELEQLQEKRRAVSGAGTNRVATIRLTLAPDAAPGLREVRLRTVAG